MERVDLASIESIAKKGVSRAIRENGMKDACGKIREKFESQTWETRAMEDPNAVFVIEAFRNEFDCQCGRRTDNISMK